MPTISYIIIALNTAGWLAFLFGKPLEAIEGWANVADEIRPQPKLLPYMLATPLLLFIVPVLGWIRLLTLPLLALWRAYDFAADLIGGTDQQW